MVAIDAIDFHLQQFFDDALVMCIPSESKHPEAVGQSYKTCIPVGVREVESIYSRL